MPLAVALATRLLREGDDLVDLPIEHDNRVRMKASPLATRKKTIHTLELLIQFDKNFTDADLPDRKMH
jgi:hypothetical protein